VLSSGGVSGSVAEAPPIDRQRQQIIAGIALVVLGLAFWGLGGLGHTGIFLLVGGLFLAAYLYRREFGFLVPACLMLGLGLGLVTGGWLDELGQPSLLGLGTGFVAITLVGAIYERRWRWWPLAPGAGLVVLGLPRSQELFRTTFSHWPWLLVVLGVAIVIAALLRPGTGSVKS
jgi:hypothetical protein